MMRWLKRALHRHRADYTITFMNMPPIYECRCGRVMNEGEQR